MYGADGYELYDHDLCMLEFPGRTVAVLAKLTRLLPVLTIHVPAPPFLKSWQLYLLRRRVLYDERKAYTHTLVLCRPTNMDVMLKRRSVIEAQRLLYR
jgi:hypothetical protein